MPSVKKTDADAAKWVYLTFSIPSFLIPGKGSDKKPRQQLKLPLYANMAETHL